MTIFFGILAIIGWILHTSWMDYDADKKRKEDFRQILRDEHAREKNKSWENWPY